MLLFSTILKINHLLNRETFMDLVTEWNQAASHAENTVPGLVWNGEKSARFGSDRLSIQIIDYSEQDIMAVRHEKITSDEVVWDTDLVVNFRERRIAVRLDRTYSEDALQMDADFFTPHFISLLIEHGYLQNDQEIPVLRTPMRITDADLEILQNVLENQGYYELPVVYVAKDFHDRDPLSILWLASRLKGVAHVVAEESKAACKKCNEYCGETAEEFGAVRIYYPSAGVARKRFLYRSPTGNVDVRLEKVVRNVILYWNSQRMDILYTWQGVNNAVLTASLHSQMLKSQAAENAKLNAENAKQNAENEMNQLYDVFEEDMKNLEKRLDELTRANEILQVENSSLRAKISAVDSMPVIYQGEEEDLYPDEIKDTLLGILTDALNHTENGTRRHDILEDVLDNNLYQHLGEQRKQRIKKMFKGYKYLTGAMKQELVNMGFQITEDGKHYKVTYKEEPRYMVTIGKTPSDSRAGMNNAAAINKIML